MSQFLLFASTPYEAYSGVKDFAGYFDTIEEAKAFVSNGFVFRGSVYAIAQIAAVVNGQIMILADFESVYDEDSFEESWTYYEGGIPLDVRYWEKHVNAP